MSGPGLWFERGLMVDSDLRGLRRTLIVLFVASAARFGWERRGGGVVPPGPDVLEDLSVATGLAVTDAERRSRPLAAGELIDPNRAEAADLDRLPGIGPETAERIVASRESEGPFLTANELGRVPGIGPATVDKLRPWLDVGATRSARSARRDIGRSAGSPRVGRRGGGVTDPERVDINRADTDLMESLPGVGPALARRIIEARSASPFRTVDDLLRVRGIGPATLERLKPLVRVGPGP